MHEGPSTLAKTQHCVQASLAGRPNDEGPGSAPGTLGWKFPGVLDCMKPLSSDCVQQSGSGFFGL